MPAAPAFATNIVKASVDVTKALLGNALFIGTVSATSGDLVKIIRVGQTVADTTYYAAIPGVAPTLVVGDAVFCVHLGAGYFVVGRISGSTTATIGTVALTAHVAGTYAVTVTCPAVRSGSLIQVSVRNNNADVTAARNVTAWVAAITASTSFVIEYRTTATMSADWQAIYRVLG